MVQPWNAQLVHVKFIRTVTWAVSTGLFQICFSSYIQQHIYQTQDMEALIELVYYKPGAGE